MDTASSPPTSRRELKKVRTRHELVAVSNRLFAEQGFADTTLEQICAEVGVHTQTLLRYFPSKAHLALAPMADVLADFTDRLEDPARSEDAITIWRAHVYAEAMRHRRRVATYLAWLDQEPVLRAMLDALETTHEDAMASALAADAGTDSGDLRCVLLATTLVRGNAAVTRRWIRDGADPRRLATTQLAVIDMVLQTFGPV
jgi:AcrR family transcriptional regulator